MEQQNRHKLFKTAGIGYVAGAIHPHISDSEVPKVTTMFSVAQVPILAESVGYVLGEMATLKNLPFLFLYQCFQKSPCLTQLLY
jgi:hypothetical protein